MMTISVSGVTMKNRTEFYKTMKNVFTVLNMETSKLILLVSYLISLILTVIVVIGAFLGFSMEYVVQIALASYLELSASNVFYFKKSCRENIFKNLPEKYLESVDINSLI
jgi:uncharacterized membrane protein